MADFGGVFDRFTSSSGSILSTSLTIVVIGGVALLILALAFWWWWVKKRWNLRVEVKLPRADGKITIGEWGKGYYNSKKGIVYIKRPGMYQPKIPVKIFDPKKYLQGEDLITIIQAGPQDYRPVLNDTWTEYIDDETGEKAAIMDIRIDPNENTQWKISFDRASKTAYSLSSFFQQFQTPIAIGIVILACFVGFAIMWTRLGSVCGG